MTIDRVNSIHLKECFCKGAQLYANSLKGAQLCANSLKGAQLCAKVRNFFCATY
jgi:hypothetical protein